MKRDILIYETFRRVYDPDDVVDMIDRDLAMNVGELIEYLKEFDPSTPVALSFDNGWTYGEFQRDRFHMRNNEDWEDWE